jgi:hypothetical protein
MATNLPGGACIGQHSVCLIRAAQLTSTCAIEGGVDSGFITTGIISATATPVMLDGTTYEVINGCGDLAWEYTTPDKIRSFDVSGELAFFDHEAMEVLFGGALVVAVPGTPFAGKNIGWSAPLYTAAAPNPIYLEFIVRTAVQGAGECTPAGTTTPYAVGHIFPKGRYTPGDFSFAAEAATVTFQGNSTNNPNLNNGPWDDYPGGNIPSSPYITVSYSKAQYDAMTALARCGYQTLPTQT